MARVLVVWCPDWPVAAAGVPSTEPVAVLDAGRVLACSAAARAEGVRQGQRRRQAQECCPELELIAHDPDRDARAFEPVLVAVESLTPRIEVLRPGACAFPARGAARYHGGEEALIAKVEAAVDRVLDDLGRCRVGIADGRFAAGLAARYGWRGGDALRAERAPTAAEAGRSRDGGQAEGGRSRDKAQADDPRSAGRHRVVPPGGTVGFLSSFRVEVLERPELTDLLIRLGLFTLGDLAALPRATVAARFGPDGVLAHRLASGLDEHPGSSRRPLPELEVATELDPPVTRVDVAAFAAKALADELVDRLERLGLACTRLRIEVETEHGEMLARVWRYEPPERPSRRGAATDPRAQQVATIAERVRWQLDGWLSGSAVSRPTGPVMRLALIPDEVVPARGRQLGFWGEESEASRRAARAFARVQGMLGPEAVRVASLRGGRGPADRVVTVAEGELPPPPDGGPTTRGGRPAEPASAGRGVRSAGAPSIGPSRRSTDAAPTGRDSAAGSPRAGRRSATQDRDALTADAPAANEPPTVEDSAPGTILAARPTLPVDGAATLDKAATADVDGVLATGGGRAVASIDDSAADGPPAVGAASPASGISPVAGASSTTGTLPTAGTPSIVRTPAGDEAPGGDEALGGDEAPAAGAIPVDDETPITPLAPSDGRPEPHGRPGDGLTGESGAGMWAGGRDGAGVSGATASRTSPSRAKARGPRPAPWPGQIPEPSPAVVHSEPPSVEVQDADGDPVTVSGRGVLSAEPCRLRALGRPWVRIVAWAGPWPVDERWWDPSAQRLARLQVTSEHGAAYLLKLQGGRWSVEATYD
jgi:protein ImuB